MARFTAEHRGGDSGERPWEWCVIDEDMGWWGCAVIFDLTREEAKALAKLMNEEDDEK